MKRILIIIILFGLCGFTSARAESEDTVDSKSKNRDTITLGVFFPYTKFYRDFAGLEDVGWGLGGRVGFNTGKIGSLDFSAFETRHNDPTGEELDFSGITMDWKLRLPVSRETVYLYGLVGFGRYVIRSDDGTIALRGNVDWNGINGYQVGFGIEIFLSKYIAANVGFTRRRIEFDYGTPTGSDMTALTKTIEFGLTFGEF